MGIIANQMAVELFVKIKNKLKEKSQQREKSTKQNKK